MPTVSLRLRIILGFFVVIGILAVANIFSSAKLSTLNQASERIEQRAQIVRSVNDYANSVSSQVKALRMFAFSGLENDKNEVMESREKTKEYFTAITQLLNEAHEEQTALTLTSASESFDQIFTQIENRIGNGQDALQVMVLSIVKLNSSAAGLGAFLSNRDEAEAKDMAKQINSIVNRIGQLVQIIWFRQMKTILIRRLPRLMSLIQS